VANYHDTGFGLVRALVPIEAAPLPLAAEATTHRRSPEVVIRAQGHDAPRCSSRIAGLRRYWEYLLDEAYFTLQRMASSGVRH
jgi:hypothetical protein